MSNNNTTLKPCPFCGSRARMSEVPGCNLYWAECPYCNAETRGEESPAAAAQKWNRRVLPVAPVPPADEVEAARTKAFYVEEMSKKLNELNDGGESK